MLHDDAKHLLWELPYSHRPALPWSPANYLTVTLSLYCPFNTFCPWRILSCSSAETPRLQSACLCIEVVPAPLNKAPGSNLSQFLAAWRTGLGWKGSMEWERHSRFSLSHLQTHIYCPPVKGTPEHGDLVSGRGLWFPLSTTEYLSWGVNGLFSRNALETGEQVVSNNPSERGICTLLLSVSWKYVP